MLVPQKLLVTLIAAGLSLSLTACGDAKTSLTEKPSIEEEDDHDHGESHEGLGRLVITNSTAEAMVYDIDEKKLLDSFSLDSAPSAVYATGGYRYAALINRTGDAVTFLDGGLWQEDHVEHLHDYEEAPLMLADKMTGSRPTHFVEHEGQVAVFFDGDAATATPASVAVFSDGDIAAKRAPAKLAYNMNMHGVAEPRGEHLLATWRRDDALSTSANPILPDQVAVYHRDNDHFHQEQILDVTCPDLHGAAQNEAVVVFGCSDGLLLARQNGDSYSAQKLANPSGLPEGLRIGSLYGHNHSDHLIGVASAHGGTVQHWFNVDSGSGVLSAIDWQPQNNAVPVAQSFSAGGEQFLILDNQGYLTALETTTLNGQSQWRYAARVDISTVDVATMPEGMNFSLSLAQNGHTAYIGDPIGQQIVVVDLDLMSVVDELTLDFAPKSVTWLGIAGEHAR